MTKEPFNTKRYIVLTPNKKDMVDAIGSTITNAYESACEVLGNKLTVDKLKAYGYSVVQIEIREVSEQT